MIGFIGVIAVAIIVAVYAGRADPENHGPEVRKLATERGLEFLAGASDANLNKGVDNTCNSQSVEQWARAIRMGATINGWSEDQQVLLDATYVDVGCAGERGALKEAADQLGVAMPSAPAPG